MNAAPTPSMRLSRTAMLIGMALPATPVWADQATLPEVQVTGQAIAPAYAPERSANPKLTAPLLDTPKSVTIIPQALIQERGANSLADVLRTTPGVTMGSGEGGTPMGDRPFIRGYEASTDIAIDCVRDLGRFTHEAFNVEQVEIVKGPGSAYSGRGATGGSINLMSKRPQNENFIRGSVGLGLDSYRRGTLDINQLVGDNAAVRLNAMKHQMDVPGRDAVDQDRWGLAPSVTFGIHSATQLTLAYYGLRADDVPDLGHPFDTGLAGARGEPVNVDRNNFYGVAGRDARSNHVDLGTIQLDHDFGNGLKLRNLTRYGQSTVKYIMSRPTIHAASGMVNRDWRASNKRNNTVANQTDLSGAFKLGGTQNQFVVGVELSRDQIKNGDTGTTSNVGRTDLANPNPYDPAYSGTRISDFGGNYVLANKTTTQALYAFNTTKFTEQWELNTGLRFDRYKVSDGELARTDNLLNYQVGVVYKPAPNGSVYLAYGTSSNPSGETTGQSGGADGAAGGGLGGTRANLKPEKNRSIELGTKWSVLDNRLQLTAAIFRTQKTNQRANDPVTGDVALIGNNRTQGLELGIAGNITPAWSIYGGYTFLDPKLTDDGAGDNDGKRLKFIAKNSFSVWSSYKITPAITLGGGANYMSQRWMNDANTLGVPSYWRFDAMASYAVNKNVNLRLNVNNLTNKLIYEGSHVGLFANVAPGRSVTLTADFAF